MPTPSKPHIYKHGGQWWVRLYTDDYGSGTFRAAYRFAQRRGPWYPSANGQKKGADPPKEVGPLNLH